MNPNLKAVSLTIAALSLFVIALVELSGVSKSALINRFSDQEEHELLQKKVSKMPRTTLLFEETLHDFGKIDEGSVVRFRYRFTNAGNNPLLIEKAVASCGCTVPSYPKEPVPPGGKGDVEVVFNSAGKPGIQQKNVMIYSNAQQPAMSIGFKAEVTAK